jgi:flagellar biosynthesis protein FlhA
MVGDATGGLAVLGIAALAILPLPPFALDLLLVCSLSISLLVFLGALYIERPLDFSAFPSLLVLVTLFRLALNLASTRMILLRGGEGGDSVGHVIRAFGDFAVGGNYVVGAVVFLILVIVNFIVITKGADRVSEVAARFTLDSLPGKQMAIDSDLAAGLIDENGARTRRKEVQMEAEFHGAMDGASKFVRGDAIAGLIIVAINVLAGMVVGVAQHGLPVGEAAATFTILSIGDGLVSQLPALLVSAGAALLVTRDSSGQSVLGSVGDQLLARPRPTGITAAVLGVLALVPGMPHVPLLGLAIATGVLSWRAAKAQKQQATPGGAGKNAPPGAEKAPTTLGSQKDEIETLLPLDLLSIEVGLGLLPLVDADKGGELLTRIGSVRRQLALELGFVVPAVHIRDEVRLRPGGYKILVSGTAVAEGEVRPGRVLAIDPSQRALVDINGESVKEPTFGLPAKWISTGDRTAAETRGCTVVDPSAVVATHVTEVIRNHADELLGRSEAQELLDIAGKDNSKVIEELVPHLMSFGEMMKVLRTLLAEGVSIRDMRSILETLADNAGQTKEPAALVEVVRQRIGRQISSQHLAEDGTLHAMILGPEAEELIRRGGRGGDAQALSRLTSALAQKASELADHDEPGVLVVAPDIRRSAAAIAQHHVPGLAVLSYRELDPGVSLTTIAIVNPSQTVLQETG